MCKFDKDDWYEGYLIPEGLYLFHGFRSDDLG